MATAADLIKASLRLLGVTAAGETPAASELADGLSSLNRMISRWSAEGLLIHAEVREEFSLVAGTQSYTIGSSGTFNTTRPIQILKAMIEDQSSGTPEYPVEIINVDQWAAIHIKSTQSPIPTKLYASGSYPLETLSLWPVPSATNKLVLYSLKPLTAFAAGSTDVSLPEGYEDAIVYNLAQRLAPEFSKEPSAAIVMEALESKANIKRMNIKPMYLECDAGVLSRSGLFDIHAME